ncbi:MAG TPA: hypothetical protein VFN02_08020 [Ktedonobacteraceae bacterium]|nr:hypothetical protein [Ktedonobacteraceae bacterium]
MGRFRPHAPDLFNSSGGDLFQTRLNKALTDPIVGGHMSRWLAPGLPSQVFLRRAVVRRFHPQTLSGSVKRF